MDAHSSPVVEPMYQLGIDIGSTTVKAVLLRGRRVVFSDYRRHNADVRGELVRLLQDIRRAHPEARLHAAVTGSGGFSVAKAMGAAFVQEVIAGTEATRQLHPDVDVVIELGGEDAKITYLHPTPEQRMNGTCAGGTGAFIDQMATLLHTDTAGLDRLAANHTQLYPIASRCGVFAKSDLQPLINQGAAHEDLAASIFTAVATQTIAGLANGRPIRGTVMFLGGPLHFLPQLRRAYEDLLPKASNFITPENAQLYVAVGAALLAGQQHVRPESRVDDGAAQQEYESSPSMPRPRKSPSLRGSDGDGGAPQLSPDVTPASDSAHSSRDSSHPIAPARPVNPTRPANPARPADPSRTGHYPRTIATLIEALSGGTIAAESARMRPLFATEEERAEFLTRHARESVPRVPIEQAHGRCWLGIDAGSTTIKAVVIDELDQIVFSHYASNEGDPVNAAVEIVRRVRSELPAGTTIVRSCATGYGEGLVMAALQMDEGVVETMAHFRAADHMMPGVTSVIDIGGQDMKYLSIRDHAVDSISVNEACSSGCGSFLQTFAATMGTDVQTFARMAMKSEAPVDLGTRCTVFMNSSVKQAQKEGADPRDISAGLSYSVIRNALYKVIKLKDPSDLGAKVVVQGGTFLNDSVLRAFELLTGREVVRPDIAGLMGAFGAALTARLHSTTTKSEARVFALVAKDEEVDCPRRGPTTKSDGAPALSSTSAPATIGAEPTHDVGEVQDVVVAEESSLAQIADLEDFRVETTRKTCRLCQNHCQMTISTFSNGERHVSGNRCERGASLERIPKKSELPNMYDWKYKRIFGYRRLTEKKAVRGDIGIPRVLNLYENYPFWFTLLSQLGFRVMISGRSDHNLFEKGMESIPSENVCYPAKLVHGHIESLREKGISTVFYPCVTYEQKQYQGQDGNFNCPVVATYPEVIRNNIEKGDDGGAGAGASVPEFRLLTPFLNLGNREYLPKRLTEVFAEWNIPEAEMRAALDAAWEEDAAVKREIREKGEEYIEWMRARGVRGIVLAGRPYHLDPEINHGIPEVINGLGMGVLTEDAVADGRLERPLRVRDQWSYHSRLYEAAARVGDEPNLEMVQLNSFGCGVDAVTADQVQEILEGRGDVHTVLKIDEVSNLGAAKIRLRSLDAAIAERESHAADAEETGAEATQTSGEVRGEENGSVVAQGLEGRRAAHGRLAVNSEVLDTTQVPADLDARLAVGFAEADPASLTDLDPATLSDPAERAAAEENRAAAAGHIKSRVAYTKQMREEGWEILAPQMAPIQFKLLAPVLRRAGFNVRVLERTSRESMETGLKYVNNDACYPAIVVIGQLLEEFVSGRSNPDRTAVVITQTGGMCRATNYAALLRKGLRDAGYQQVPVIAASVQGFEDNPGFEITMPMVHKAIQAIVLGDMLQAMLLRVRPYELVPGSARELYERWDSICTQWLTGEGYSENWGGRMSYRRLVRECVREFDALKLRDIPRKPRVGLVGEILVKFHPDANNHAVDVIEEEGCEAELPGLMQFFHNSAASSKWDKENLGIGGKSRWLMPLALWAMQRYEDPVRAAFLATNGKFEPHRDIREMAARSTDIASMGNQAGEGWYLTAEMVDMIEHGCPNIICAQPFACLPNHIVGKGMFRALRNRYPQANIVAVDFDPGASEVNQLNRIKLMLSTALGQHGEASGGGSVAPAAVTVSAEGILWNDDGDLAESDATAGDTCPVVSLLSNGEKVGGRTFSLGS
ncbi:MAG: acyl-CoA dehydratase activase-related protein [Ancrocorticia sp.]